MGSRANTKARGKREEEEEEEGIEIGSEDAGKPESRVKGIGVQRGNEHLPELNFHNCSYPLTLKLLSQLPLF
ncbi:MAG TPA: hypothetical protein V6C97_27380 [Oculatellaceae cyanobacterium]